MMTKTPDLDSQPADVGIVRRFSGYAAAALKYWEPRRIVYNSSLALVVMVHFAAGLPGSRESLSLDMMLGLFFLAVLANVCYSVVYLPDVFVQFSGLHTQWRIGRVILLVVGTAFAATITHFLAKGIFRT